MIKVFEGDTKSCIRQRVWNYIEDNDLALFPRPVHNRIPNFKGAREAGDKISTLDVFKKARTVKVNPDKPQEQARFHALEMRKTLLVPTPRLAKGLFNKIVPPGYSKEILRKCATSQGVKEYSQPVGLGAKLHIDVIIIGAVAVSTSGYRLGKGEGYADLEYAMMKVMNAVDENTLVISTVHDCQVIDSLPENLFGVHDLCVDMVVTPTRVIECPRKTKPQGVSWGLLDEEKLSKIPVLKVLREKQRKEGADVRLRGETGDSSKETQ